MSRQKTVFRSDEIAHIWANQHAPHGRSPGNLSFSGDAISSYATEMARFIEHNGKRAVIINDTSYSVTTSKSQGRVRGAIPDYVTKFYIGGIGRGCSLNFHGEEGNVLFKYAIEQAEEFRLKSLKARQRKDGYLEAQSNWLQRAKEINEFFELGQTVDEDTIKRLEEIAEQARQQRIANEAKAEEDRREKFRVNYEAWKTGNGPRHLFPDHLYPTAFRIEDQEVVSSYGARVPLREARVALRFIEKHRNSGWKTNGEKFSVGGYQLVQIGHTVQIGCHHITWEEFDRISTLIKAELPISFRTDQEAGIPGEHDVVLDAIQEATGVDLRE